MSLKSHFFLEKNNYLHKVFLCVFLLFITFNGNSQSTSKQKKLQAEKARLLKKRKQINSLLINTKKEKKNALEHVGDLDQKIKVSSKLIETIDQEASLIGSKINKNTTTIHALEKELKLLKKDYANMIYKSYKSKSNQSRMMFLLSSENFHQAYKRLKYMEQYTNFRKKQGEKIVAKKIKIDSINNTLKSQKIQKENILTEQKNEQAIIESEKEEQKKLISKIKSKEKKYIAQIEKNQREARKLDRQIEKLIRDAIAASKKKNKSSSKGFSLTPEAKLLASKFEQNKSKLPWPVLNALVIQGYGRVRHHLNKNVMTQSNGIRIATNKGAEAKAIFEGEVLAVQVGSDGLKTIMLQHGNYISLYRGLETIHVKKGDKIALNQSLGKIFTNKVSGKTVLIFQIWKDTKTQNPKSWLLRL